MSNLNRMAFELSHPEDSCWAVAAGSQEARVVTMEEGDPMVAQVTVD